MTLDDNHTLTPDNQHTPNSDSPRPMYNNDRQKSTGQLISELSKLLLQLLWVIIKKILKIIIKSILFIIHAVEDGITRWRIFWNDNDTQQKVAKTKLRLKIWGHKTLKFIHKTAKLIVQWTVTGSKAAAKYTIVGIQLTIVGIIWTAQHIVLGIIHMKPTVIKLWELTKRVAKAFVAWCTRANRGRKLRNIRRRRNYEAFVRNGGIKGMLNKWRTNLKAAIQNYMDEEQEEAHPNAITEDDILEEEIGSSKAHIIGKHLFSSVKNIVDIDDDK